ncbi:MAG: hypothetical protein ACI4WS_08865 [Oscillospiraceae bacterium]
MKHLKRTSFLCAAAIASSLTLAGCGENGNSDAGRYNLYSMEEDGTTFTISDMESMYSEMGMEAPESYIQLNADGTGSIVMFEEDAEEFKWKNGTMTIGDETISYTIKDGKLTVSRAGSSIVFEKSN